MEIIKKIIEPDNVRTPYYQTVDCEIDYAFSCDECGKSIALDSDKQIKNCWNGKSDSITDRDFEFLKAIFQIGLSNKLTDGGLPVFDKLTCLRCDSKYISYCGVLEYSNSAYLITLNGLLKIKVQTYKRQPKMERIEIYSSKKKSLLLLIGSTAFVVLGFWLLLEADNLTGWRARNPIFTCGIGIASILFFGLGVFIGIKRLIKSEIALIIDTKGLNVNPKKSLNEYINWSDINGFEEIKIKSTRIVIIGVKNPDYWLNKETSGFRRKLMQFNFNNYNSPFNISASGLDISSDKLIETLNNYYDRHKNEA